MYLYGLVGYICVCDFVIDVEYIVTMRIQKARCKTRTQELIARFFS